MYFRRIYVRNVSDGYLIAGVAMKNKEAFKEEFEGLRGKFDGISS
jgi:hypothetical protein